MKTVHAKVPLEIEPSKDGGLVLSVHRGSGDDDYRSTSAASLSNLLRYIGEADFVLITNCRRESVVSGERVARTRGDNAREFWSMLQGLPSAGRKYGATSFWLVAHWTREATSIASSADAGARVLHFVEHSCLMKFTKPNFREELLSRAVRIATAGEQEGFITRFGGSAALRNAQGQFMFNLASDNEVEAAWRAMSIRRSLPSEMRPPLSELILNASNDHRCADISHRSCYNVTGPDELTPFRFYLARPDNNSGRMMFSYMGLWSGVQP